MIFLGGIVGYDYKDFISLKVNIFNYIKFLFLELWGKIIGLIKEFFGKGLDFDVE